eukprot:TRINITY_DN5744_c0_g1_i1.p1 TRINITY_DN5744_c0_g1~~TRINITY_DN5744_c0_g1_i1.p1  ORF type:complete len:611 (-),score=160.21 TRINITY_DN5744_c0_g1_i1:189-2021(-)
MSSDSLSILSKGNGTWLAISSREERNQIFLESNSSNIPKDLIMKAWKNKERIKYIFYNEINKNWILITEQSILKQTLVISKKKIPHDKIRECWQMGLSLSMIYFHRFEETYIIFFDKLHKYQEYYICPSIKHISSTIEKGWQENLCVQTACFGNNYWIIVLEEDNNGGQSSYDFYDNIPNIQDIWDRGESLDIVATNGKIWLTISSLQESKSGKDSHYLFSRQFPSNWIENFVWAKKALISPFEIKFTLDKAPHCFDDGQKLDNLIQLIKKKQIHESDFPMMRVIEMHEEIFTLNNRRLYCFQQGMKEYDEDEQLITILFTKDQEEFKIKNSSHNGGTLLELFCFGDNCPCKKHSAMKKDENKNFSFGSGYNRPRDDDTVIDEMKYESEMMNDSKSSSRFSSLRKKDLNNIENKNNNDNNVKIENNKIQNNYNNDKINLIDNNPNNVTNKIDNNELSKILNLKKKNVEISRNNKNTKEEITLDKEMKEYVTKGTSPNKSPNKSPRKKKDKNKNVEKNKNGNKNIDKEDHNIENKDKNNVVTKINLNNIEQNGNNNRNKNNNNNGNVLSTYGPKPSPRKKESFPSPISSPKSIINYDDMDEISQDFSKFLS